MPRFRPFSCLAPTRLAPGASSLALAATLAAGCGGALLTHRNIDEPRGHGTIKGAPRNPTYLAQTQTSQHRLHVTVFEQSECDVIRVRLVSRARQTLRDDEVVDQEAPTLVQIEEGVQGTEACEKRFARDALVLLQVGDATYRLGQTSATGELHINVADLLKRSLYGTEAGADSAAILVQPRGSADQYRAGEVSLSQLDNYEKRVDELLAAFRPLLDKPQEQMSGADLARSYELYAQLDAINAGDPRVEALQARFVERVYGRKEVEAAERLERNLKALSRAKELLKAISANSAGYLVPAFVQVAIEQENPTAEALRWALGQLALGIRQEPAVCGPESGRFSWEWFGSRSWQLPTELALNFLRYAYNDAYSDRVVSLCARHAARH